MSNAPKILVTGGAGFIGSHTVVELVSAGYRPIIVDNFSNSERSALKGLREILGHDVPCYEVDCANLAALGDVLDKESGIIGAIHFAASKAVSESTRKPLQYFQNNLGSTVSVLQALLQRGISNFVFSSSCTVYGQPDLLPVTEQSPFKAAESPYGRTKQMCEDILADVIRSGAGLKAATLRYFNPVGAHTSALIGELPLGPPENLLPYITQTAVGLRSKLTIFGNDYPTRDGTCIRDYIHVVDLALAHVRALDWLRSDVRPSFNEAFNLGTGSGSSVLEAVNTFERVTQVKLNWAFGPRRPGDVIQTYADASKAAQVLNWKTQRTLDDALLDAYRWQLRLQERQPTTH